MARLVGSVSGRLQGELLGVTMGPTGLGWSQTGVGVPSALSVRTDDAGYTDETISLVGTMSIWYFDTISTRTDSNTLMHFQDTLGVNSWNELGLSGGFPRLALETPAQTLVVNVTGTTQVTAGAWNHILVSWDLNAGNTYANDFHMYLNDIDIKPGSPTVFLPGGGSSVEWGTGNLFVTTYRLEAGNGSGTSGQRYSAIWLDFTRYIDFSVTANRRKFITAGGGQLPLGVDGSIPTGFAPPWYVDNPAASITSPRGTITSTLTVGAGTTIVDAAGPPVG